MKQNICDAYLFKLNLNLFLLLLFSLFSGISHYGYSQDNTKADSLEQILLIQDGSEKASTLNLLGEAYLGSNPSKSLEYAKQAYFLSVGQDYRNEIFAIVNFVDSYNALRKYDSADIFVEKGLELCLQQHDTVHIMQFLTNIGWTYFYQGEYNKANASFADALKMIEIYLIKHPDSKDVDKMNYAKLLSNKASVYTKMAYYDSAIVFFKRSLEYRIENNAEPKYLAPILLNIGAISYKNNNYKEAWEYFNEALELYSQLKDTARMASCLSNLGMVYKAKGDTAMAIINYKKSLKLRSEINDNAGQIATLNNLGTAYLQTQQAKLAKGYLQEAIRLNKNGRYRNSMITSLQNMATYFVHKKQFANAIELSLKSLKIARETGARNTLENNYKILSEAYEGLDNFSESLKYYKMHKSIHDSIFNAESRENYNKLQVELETTKKEKEIELLKKDSEKQALEHQMLQNRQLVIILISLSLILLIAIVALSLFSKRKKDKLIHRQKELFHKKEKELATAELEKSKLKEEELQQSILYKSKQLSTHALHMMQKNTMLQEIQSDIKTMSKKAPVDDKPNYKRIYQQITQSLRSQKDWDVFKLYFEDVNKNFYQKLNKINPELTTNDHRLCALIKLNMTSKEMASVLNVAPNSIKSSRYRLKKKLGLDVEADLEEFIRRA